MSEPPQSGPVVAVGTVLPPLERRLTLVRMVAYAGATWDWYRTHYDPEAVAAAKLPGPIVDGQMLGALLAEQALDWGGPQALVRRMSFRFRSPVLAGETVRCESTVVGVDLEAEGAVRITLQQRIVTADDRVVLAPATIELLRRE